MAKLVIDDCELYEGEGPEKLRAALGAELMRNSEHDISVLVEFMGELAEPDPQLIVALNKATFDDVKNTRQVTELLNFVICGRDQIDALGRYCNMVLDHHKPRASS